MSTSEEQRCSHCDRLIEVCTFCEREECGTQSCYRCLVVELREFVPQPHTHGG
jgi:hypothetical protein